MLAGVRPAREGGVTTGSSDVSGRTHPPLPNPSPTGGEGLQAGWSARLKLRFEATTLAGASRTVLRERSHVGPLRVLKPLYPEGDAVCHAVLVHPPGGIVEGDSLSVEVKVDAGASALITTPGAQKWYRSSGRTASAETHLTVADGASLEWLPQEAMAYDGARAQQLFTIALAPTARFFGWEMLCLGRTTRGERFASGEFRQGIRLVRAGSDAPLWRESMHLVGNDPLLTSPLGLRGLPVMATAWIALGGVADGGGTDVVLAKVRDALAGEPLAAASAPDEGLIVVKAIGDAPEAVRNLLIAVWKSIRLQVFAREPQLPRIWST